MDSPQMIQVSAALIATLNAETGLPKRIHGQPLDQSQSRGVQDNTDELDRTLEGQDERRRADVRRTSNAENEVVGELVCGNDRGENRMEVSTIEEDVWTLTKKHEDIQDDVAFVDGDRNKNYAAYEQKHSLDSVLTLDANDAAPDDEVVKEAEAVTVEGEAVDLPEVDTDRKHEATLHDVVTEEVLVSAVGAPQTGWRVDRFPQGPGRMRLVSTPLWSLRAPTCEPELLLIIGKAAQRDVRAKWRADDHDEFVAQVERRSSWRRAKRGGVVACGVQGPLEDGGGELPGAGSAGDGHACLPCAPVRAINDDPVVTSEGGLLAQRARRRCDTCVETLVTHGHAFLELCCFSDSELAAVVVKHSVVVRVTSLEDFQLTSARPALDRLLMICKAYEVVANIWVLIPCTECMPFRHVNEKLGAETGDLAMTYKLVVAAVGLCRHTVGIADGFSWKWSNSNELWKLVVVRNFFAKCGSSSCLVSTAAVGQQFVDREGGVFYVKMLEMFKKVTGAAHVHILDHQLRAAKDKADGNGLNSSVQLYTMAVHSDSSRHAAEEAFLRFAGNATDAKFCNGHFMYINAWRNITRDPIENNYLAVCDETSLVSSNDYLVSDLFIPGARLTQCGLSDHNAAKHRW